MGTLIPLLVARARREKGQTMAEYAMVLAVITIAIVAAIAGIAAGIDSSYGETSDIVNGI